jgi:hypothetical protein
VCYINIKKFLLNIMEEEKNKASLEEKEKVNKLKKVARKKC